MMFMSTPSKGFPVEVRLGWSLGIVIFIGLVEGECQNAVQSWLQTVQFKEREREQVATR